MNKKLDENTTATMKQKKYEYPGYISLVLAIVFFSGLLQNKRIF